MLFFATFRLAFLIYHIELSDLESPMSLLHGVALDASVASYLVIVPLFLSLFSLFFAATFFKKLASWYNRLLLFGMIVLLLSNLLLYSEWLTLLNRRALDYLRTPEGLLSSVQPVLALIQVLFLVCVFVVFDQVRQKITDVYFPKKADFRWISLLLFPIVVGGLFFCLRGGLGVMPINESSAYFSTYMFNNHAATNPAWHFGHVLIEKRAETNPYQTLSEMEAKAFNPAFLKKAKSEQKSTLKPNVVIIGMESLSTQFLESYGGYEGLTPFLDDLARKNTQYTQCYGSGYRTDQGFAALISGYPSLPDQSIILLEDKVQKLPSLARAFSENGYKTAFLYGGELTFANLGTYVAQMGFDKVVGIEDFPRTERTQRWGVDDALFLDRAADELAQLPEPYFAFAMTLSCHAPFDVPGYDEKATEAEQFKNAVRYADVSLALFFEKIKASPSFERTIFVFVADHGHPGTRRYPNDTPEARHVPLILVENGISSPKPNKNDFICNHHDIAQILMDKLRLETKEVFPMAKSTDFKVDTSGGYAYYTNEDGLGWICKAGRGFYRFSDKQWIFPAGTQLDTSQQKNAQAYLQNLYNDFIEK